MTINRYMKALGAGALAIGMFAAAPAEAVRFKVRNCTDHKIYVCSYREGNDKMLIAATAKSIEAGEREKFHCSGRAKKEKYCKAFIAVTGRDIKHRLGQAARKLLKKGGGKHKGEAGKAAGEAAGGAAGGAAAGTIAAATIPIVGYTVEGTVVTTTLLAASGGAAAIGGLVVGGAAIGVGIVFAVKGLKKNAICRRIVKDKEIRRKKDRTGEKEDRFRLAHIGKHDYHFDLKFTPVTSGTTVALKPEPVFGTGDSCPK